MSRSGCIACARAPLAPQAHSTRLSLPLPFSHHLPINHQHARTHTQDYTASPESLCAPPTLQPYSQPPRSPTCAQVASPSIPTPSSQASAVTPSPSIALTSHLHAPVLVTANRHWYRYLIIATSNFRRHLLVLSSLTPSAYSALAQHTHAAPSRSRILT